MNTARMTGSLSLTRILGAALIGLLSLTGLSGCDKVSTALNQDLSSGNSAVVSTYSGPAPRDADVDAYRRVVWESLRGATRCGSCHAQGGQTPSFVRADDINQAYDAALTVVDRNTPAQSKMVTKVAGGHHCWLASNSACAQVLTAYLEGWLKGVSTGSGTQVTLTPPAAKNVSPSRSWPGSAQFGATVHPLLTQYCANCHTGSAKQPQAPFFASSNVATAYEAVKSTQKIDLNTPANSRLVVRLRDEFHNCWSDCASDATAMLGAINAFVSGAPVTQLPPQTVASKALKLGDGVIASGGSRQDGNVIAKYEFKTGSGNVLYDTSGVNPALDLTLSGNAGVDFAWVDGWGVEIYTGMAKGDTGLSKKLSDRIKARGGAYTIEAWVVPANLAQTSPIVSYSASTTRRNATLGQVADQYSFQNRSSTTGANGDPALLETSEALKATLQHVVATYDQVNGRRLYVNGVFTGDIDSTQAGNLNDWDDTFALVLGNEVSGNRQWKGTLRMVAIHDAALSAGQVFQNFAAGVGEKYFLLFGVSDLVGVPQSYIMLEAAQFDNYSYVFTKPTFITLDANATVGMIPVKGMRIGVNGKEVAVGQAYARLDTVITASNQLLSSIGTVIARDMGSASDEFFLTFEQLGSYSNVVVEADGIAPARADTDPMPDIGLRTFDEINASMATVTGVSANQTNVKTTFDTIRQQLPTVENIGAFLSAHQVAVSQLAIEYCNALVEDTTLRASFFPGFNFGASAQTAFDTAGRDLIVNPLFNNIVGSNLSTQPDEAAVKTEINSLVTRLTACAGTGTCAADRTRTVVKAACAATLGSAALLIQ